jgi:hypothetical protein
MTIRVMNPEEGRQRILDAIFKVMNREGKYGLIVVFNESDSLHFSHNNDVRHVIAALRSYANDIEKTYFKND